MGCFSTPSPPPAPDYAAAATAQGAANEAAARTSGRMNNPNVYGPTGSQTVTWEGDQPTIRQNLSPQEQAIFDAEQGNRLGMQGLAGQGLESLGGLIGTGIDLSGAPRAGTAFRPGATGMSALDPRSLSAAPSAFTGATGLPDRPGTAEDMRTQVINAMMGRSNEGFAQREDQVNSDLVARGIRPGTEAYAREMERIDQARNDARQQAELGADEMVSNAFQRDLANRNAAFGEQITEADMMFGQGMDLRGLGAQEQAQRFGQQGQMAELQAALQAQGFGQQNQLRAQDIAEMLMQRQTPLNEITALMSGSQVNSPFQMPGASQNSQVAPAPIFGATQAQGAWDQNAYNQRVGSRNNMLGGLFGIGSALAGGW